MSTLCSSDCFSDLLCDEDSSGFLSRDFLECSSEIECASDVEESIAACIEEERQFVPGFDYFSRFQTSSLDASDRADSVAWILLVQAYYGFHPLTAYLAVNYLDRFLYSHRLPQANGWPLQLLSVACLSLAAKMEEPLAPCLLDLQVEGAKYLFEPKTVCRMELLVLRVLDWRLRSITPYNFIEFFAFKVDPTGALIKFLISRASDIILSNIEETSFLEYRPSCIAATALLCATNEIPSLPLVNPEDAELWCNGLGKESLIKCYQLTQKLVLHGSRRKPPKILPQLRVTLQAEMRIRMRGRGSAKRLTGPDRAIILRKEGRGNKGRVLNMCLRAFLDANRKKPSEEACHLAPGFRHIDYHFCST